MHDLYLLGISDVDFWLRLDGRGHVLALTNSGWNMTVCGIFTPAGDVTKKKPVRHCVKCIRDLSTMRKLENANVQKCLSVATAEFNSDS